jgi:signal transduction histidine kinase
VESEAAARSLDAEGIDLVHRQRIRGLYSHFAVAIFITVVGWTEEARLSNLVMVGALVAYAAISIGTSHRYNRHPPPESSAGRWVLGLHAQMAVVGLLYNVIFLNLAGHGVPHAMDYLLLILALFCAGGAATYAPVRGAGITLIVFAMLPQVGYHALAPDGHGLTSFIIVIFIVFMSSTSRTLHHEAIERLELTRELKTAKEDAEQRRQEAIEARDRAMSANRAKSTFLANMSHELRTPLNAVIGYGELVQEDVAEAGLDHCVDDLEKIVASSKHLLGLINDVLDVAKIEAGKVELLQEEIDVAELIRDVASAVEPLVSRNGNTFALETADDVGTIVSDSTRLRQILFNLLSNAAKFTKNGKVSLIARRRPRDGADAVEFVVADTGIGMTAEQQEHVFDSFRQADASTTREYGGTGLGLTITKHFAELLGGRVSLSSAPGRGSEFTVSIPATASAPSDSAIPG